MVGPLAQDFAGTISRGLTIAIRYDLGNVSEAATLHAPRATVAQAQLSGCAESSRAALVEGQSC